jgi:hypothetical protein
MNTNTTFRLGLGVLAALCLQISGNLYGASYLYQDDFSNNAGALNGRATASGFGAWTADSAFQVGSDKITINSNTPDYNKATFALPTLGASDTLSLSITVRPSGSLFTGFGFTSGSDQYVSNTGYNWIYFTGLGNANPRIEVLTGRGPEGLSYSASLTNLALNFDASLPTTFQYTYSAQKLTISASNGGNSSLLVNNLDVSTTPLSGYSNFALQFEGQTLGDNANPAYVDRLSVSIIPEPSTFSMLLCGLGAMTVFYRRR